MGVKKTCSTILPNSVKPDEALLKIASDSPSRTREREKKREFNLLLL